MIGPEVERVISRAVALASSESHEFVTVEHLFMALLREPIVRQVLTACGGDPAVFRKDLSVYLINEVPKIPRKPGQKNNSILEPDDESEPPPEPKLLGESGDKSKDDQLPAVTLGFQRTIQRALFHAQSAGKSEIVAVDLLVSLFQAKDSQSLFLLNREEVERLDLLNFISHGTDFDGNQDQPPLFTDDQEAGENESDDAEAGDAKAERLETLKDSAKRKSLGNEPLELYTQNLNDLAKAKKLDPLVGRKDELERMVQTLCRRRKNNPLLVGEAGVGKTALAEGLATLIVDGQVPSLLSGCVIYSLDLGALIAGTKFRGDFEQRLKKVVGALQAKSNKGEKPVLFIDEIHTIIGAGSVGGGSLDAANLLKPMLSRGEIRCIGSTTYHEYRASFEKDHALNRRFQKIDVVEPTQEEAVQILMGLKERFETHHQVKYPNDTIRSMVELSVKHLNEKFLPDKAIDLLDEVGARIQLKRRAKSDAANAKNLEGEDSSENLPIEVTVADVEDLVAQVARIPAKAVSNTQRDRLKSLESDLKLMIFGQDQAIESLATAIKLSRSGLRSGEKPIGSFLFCGPTGVGKTELSKQLALALGVPLVRFDMSEYSEKHTVSRLIGAPPGYVGFDQAGLLTEQIRKQPHSVVLLDEIEKAHADIWNILLQVMDHGSLTDNNGRKADFRNVILLMTSNAGSRDLEKRPLGFSSEGQGVSNAQKAVEQTFTPEFRNRLDGIVFFNALDPITIAQVVDKQLAELESQLLTKNVECEFSATARQWLADKGYDRALGARPMARLIQDKIKKPLASELLFGRLEKGGKVLVDLKDGELCFVVLSSGTSGSPSATQASAVSSQVKEPAEV